MELETPTTPNKIKYADWSRPIKWTSNKEKAMKSIFQYKLDDETGKYFTTKLGIYNGFLGLVGKVRYYIPETDEFRTVRKCW